MGSIAASIPLAAVFRKTLGHSNLNSRSFPMLPERIANLLIEGESETLEFKRSTGERVQVAESLCAMLNARGGRVLIGIAPNGAAEGQEVSDDTIQRLSNEFQRIEPQTLPTIEIVPLEGAKRVIEISASGPGAMRPYSYKNVAYRRVGNTNRRMSSEEYNRMLLERMHSDQRWENQLAARWTVDDLDVDEIRQTISQSVERGRLAEPGTRAPKNLLMGLGLVKDDALTRAAVALFGASERLMSDMPQCLLRVARFRGVDRSEFIDNRQFRGNAFYLLRMAERFLLETLPIASRITPDSFVRIDEPLYPPMALREALTNAICHRDYSIGGGSIGVAVYDDRLEVTSTGPLPFGITPSQLFAPHESRPWNPMIAHVFYRRGIIEEWGRGTLKMAEMMASAGLPPPEIEDANGAVTARFRPSRYVPPQRIGLDLTELQRAILATLSDSQGMALRDVCSRLDPNTSERMIRRNLATLRTLKMVRVTGRGRGAKWLRL